MPTVLSQSKTEIEITMRKGYMPFRMAKTQKTDHSKKRQESRGTGI
jgi:hypothetical protein